MCNIFIYTSDFNIYRFNLESLRMEKLIWKYMGQEM